MSTARFGGGTLAEGVSEEEALIGKSAKTM